MQQSNDLRARILKGAVTRIFEQAWSLLKQYDQESLDYFWRNQRLTLDDAAFDNKFVLKPNGSVDGYSREREIQKLMQLRQLSAGAPWIKTSEIDKKIVELMDAQWVAEIYEEPQDIQADEQEDQAVENSLMLDGFLPRVMPNDDHLVHLQTEDGFIGWRGQQGQPIPPQLMQIFMQHMGMHIQAARQNKQYWQQHGQEIMPFQQKMAQTMKQMQQQQMAQQQAGAAMANLRGGAVPAQTASGSAPAGMAPPPVPPSGPNLPQPGQPSAGVPTGNGELPMG
jgi:hypothetical protein